MSVADLVAGTRELSGQENLCSRDDQRIPRAAGGPNRTVQLDPRLVLAPLVILYAPEVLGCGELTVQVVRCGEAYNCGAIVAFRLLAGGVLGERTEKDMEPGEVWRAGQDGPHPFRCTVIALRGPEEAAGGLLVARVREKSGFARRQVGACLSMEAEQGGG